MENSPMSNQGFIKLSRSLHTDPLWRGLTTRERHVFMTLLHHVAFSSYTMDDHGTLVTVNPGQFLTTEREFSELCNHSRPKDMKRIERNFVARTWSKLNYIGFLSQKISHKKTLLTLTRKDIYEISEPKNELKLSQTQAKDEPEKKKDKKEKKDNINNPPSVDAASLLEYFNNSLFSNLPEIKKNSASKDAKSFDQLLKDYSVSQIKDVINFSHHSEFWKSHVHTPIYLSRKFSKLLIQLNQGNKQYATSKKHIQNTIGTGLDKFDEPKYSAKRTISG
jgi:hypothetical protein